MSFLNSLQHVFQEAVFPSVCFICQKKTPHDNSICSSCRPTLPRIITGCPCCGQPLFTQSSCGHCQHTEIPWNQSIIPYRYEGELRKAILTLKFGGNLSLARELGHLLADSIKNHPQRSMPEKILPVPLHKKRIQERGFNQVVEIARTLSKRLDIGVDPHAHQRRHYTKPQAQLNKKQREKNVRDAFYVSPNPPYRHIALLDDVYTTGSTLTMLAKQWQKVGVKTIDIWCLARG